MAMQVNDTPTDEQVVETAAEDSKGTLAEIEQNSETVKDESGDQTDETLEGDEDEVPGDDETKKPKTGFEKRIDKLNAKISARDQELEYWRKSAVKEPPPPVPQVGKPKFDDFKDIEAYAEAISDWKIDQKLSEVEARRAQATALQTYRTRLEEFTKTTPDFQEVLDDVKHVSMSNIALEAIGDSELGPAIAYALAGNVAEAERISKLNPMRQVIEVGKLEERLKASVKIAPKQKVSDAPAPIKPSSGKGAAKVADLFDPNISQADFNRIRAAQIEARSKSR